MPQALAAVIIKAVGVAAGSLAAQLITAAVTLAVTLGLNFIAQALFGRGVGKPSDGQQIVRTPVGSRYRRYGVQHVGGQLSFFESRGGTLAMAITTGHGKQGAILEHRINDRPVTVGGGGVLSDAKFRGKIKVITRDGDDAQTAIAELTALFTEWTSDHRQRGCSLAAVICAPTEQKFFSEVYEGNKQPEYSQVAEFGLLYDPRKDSTNGGSGAHRLNDKSTWEWSDNAALVIGDYWAHDDGYGAGADGVNWANIAAEADICDQTVTTVDAATIARWRIWGSYALATDERKQVQTEMLKACDGQSWEDADGRLNLRVGRWTAPTVHLNDNHIVGIVATKGAKAYDRTNEVKIVYTEAAIGYREQESAPAVDVAAQAALGRPESQRFDIFYAPHHNQAARLGKRLLRKLGDRWHLTVMLNLYGLMLIGERFVWLASNELGLAETAFEISALKLDFANGMVEVGLSEVEADDWAFDAASEEGDPPNVPPDTYQTPTVPVPTGLTLTAVAIALGATNGVGIQASWAAHARDGLTVIAEYREGAGAWQSMSVNDDERKARTLLVTSGVAHDVRIKAVTISGRESAWSATVAITPTADNSGVSAPTALSASGGAGTATFGWRNPTEPALAYARQYRGTSNVFASAVQIGGDFTGGLGATESANHTGLAPATYWFWARAFNAGGTPSAIPTPVTAVVT